MLLLLIEFQAGTKLSPCFHAFNVLSCQICTNYSDTFKIEREVSVSIVILLSVFIKTRWSGGGARVLGAL